ncbi:hypothetical protein OQA88_3981 [Cercophora sp. LCS_1]
MSSQQSDQSLLERLNALKKNKPSPLNFDQASSAATAETPLSREDALAARLRSLRSKTGSGESEPPSVGPKTAQPPDPFIAETAEDPYHFEEDDLVDLIDGVDEFTLEDSESHNSEAEDEHPETLHSGPGPDHVVPSRITKAPDPAGSDSDSETEHTTESVEKILSQVQDEINPKQTDATSPAVNAPGTTTDNDSPFFSLPTVPSTQPPDPPVSQTHEAEGQRRSIDFENDIATRLASLRGLGSGVNVDAFGLPIAPNFKPEDRSTKTAASLVTKKVGYTDEDQKAWCIVCLDDATVRCIGCDNDVYCSRCWKDMHLGPRAGYDERGHKAVRFEK